MTDYTDMNGAARYAEVERLALAYFESKLWKARLAHRYGLTPQTISNWRKIGAPQWALVAMVDATKARRLDVIAAQIRDT